MNRSRLDVLVVGGGPAGSSAAIYAARKGIRTGIVAERFGVTRHDVKLISGEKSREKRLEIRAAAVDPDSALALPGSR